MTTQPKMTPEQARSFDRYSAANAILVKICLECGCEPYRDVFTFKRWKAQGYHVNKGERSIRLPVIMAKEIEDTDTGESKTIRIKGNAPVFCRHQVTQRA